uniref:Uncharacterized protein n=1 Tax=Triticum urartu TaxID=4572 RepID=A0A8R7QE83_TRIUA
MKPQPDWGMFTLLKSTLEPAAAAPAAILPPFGPRPQHGQLRLPHVPREPICRRPRRRPARPELSVVLHPRGRVGQRLVGALELDEELRGLGPARWRAHVRVVLQRQPAVRALDLLRAHVRRVLQGQHLVVVASARRADTRARGRRRLHPAVAVSAPPAKAGAEASRLARAPQRGGTGAGGVHG